MYILIDNYDSFTYNVYHLFAMHSNDEVRVIRNDALTIDEIKALNPKGILISPGPGTPKDAGICVEMIKELKTNIPMFGVCLGLQSMAEAFGATIIRAPLPMHGKVSQITHSDKKLLKNIPKKFSVTRYHSLCIDPTTLPDDIVASAYSDDGVIQAIYHKKYPLYAVQFHPESIRTEYGDKMIQNFLKLVEDFYQ